MGDAETLSAGALNTGVAGRYATALFDLAKDAKALDTVAGSLTTLRAALDESADFAALTTNPLVSRTQAAAAIAGSAQAMGLDSLTTKFLGVLAHNRRLARLGAVISSFRQLVARHRGEISATVTSARPLTGDQLAALTKKLRLGLGQDVAIDARVDPSLLGGLTVKVGSRLIDSSLKTKLDTLSLAMKG